MLKFISKIKKKICTFFLDPQQVVQVFFDDVEILGEPLKTAVFGLHSSLTVNPITLNSLWDIFFFSLYLVVYIVLLLYKCYLCFVVSETLPVNIYSYSILQYKDFASRLGKQTTHLHTIPQIHY